MQKYRLWQFISLSKILSIIPWFFPLLTFFSLGSCNAIIRFQTYLTSPFNNPLDSAFKITISPSEEKKSH